VAKFLFGYYLILDASVSLTFIINYYYKCWRKAMDRWMRERVRLV